VWSIGQPRKGCAGLELENREERVGPKGPSLPSGRRGKAILHTNHGACLSFVLAVEESELGYEGSVSMQNLAS